MTALVTTRPLWLNANTGIYTAWDQRSASEFAPGEGVADVGSFRVIQRQAGANMSVDIGASGVGLQRAWVRGDTRGGQGMYLVDSIDRTAPGADTYVAQLNDTVSAADGSNPRIDQVILEVLDQQVVGASNLAQIRVVAGTPSGGATLDNRTGAAALPATSLLLADVLVPAASSSVVTANIRDRRAFPLSGNAPPTFTFLDSVSFVPHPAVLPSFSAIQLTATLDSQQACALMYLPRRIVAATKIRFRYLQSTTANTGNFKIGIYDASGRKLKANDGVSDVETAATAYTGTANQGILASVTIPTTTFEAGYYWVAIGNGAGTASGGISAMASFNTAQAPAGSVPNVLGFAASGGTTLPQTIPLGFTDQNSISGALTTRLGCPIISLSVG